MSSAVLTKNALQQVLVKKGVKFAKSATKAQLEELYKKSVEVEPKAQVGESILGEY